MTDPAKGGARRVPLVLALLVALAGLVAWLLIPAEGPGPHDDEGSGEVAAADDAGEAEAPEPPLLEGRVVAAGTSRGIRGASVFLDGEAVARTDAEGRFQVTQANAGTFSLTASAEGYTEPPPGERGPLSVHLEPERTVSGVSLTLWPGASVSGSVVAGGRPVAGAALSLYYESAPGTDQPFVIESTVRSGADGAFSLWPVHPGRLRVLVEADGYAMGESEERLAESGEPISGLLIDLGASALLTGRVVDPEGRGVADAEVWLISSKTARRSTRTDEAGRFELRGLPAAPIEVHARASGYEDSRPAGVQLAAGEEVELTIPLARALGFGGLVTSPDGEPVPGAVVTYVPALEAAGQRRGGVLMGPRVVSDARGRFWVSQVADVPLVLVATHPEYTPSDETRVQVGATRDIVLVLHAGGSLSGQVTDAETRQPVTTYEVTMVSFRPRNGESQGGGGLERLRVADADGRYRFAGLMPGTYTIAVLADGYRAERVEGIEVYAAQETRNVDVRLGRGATLTGMVQDSATGQALQGVMVSVSTLYGDGYRRGGPMVATGADGRFRIDGLPPGPRSLNLRLRGYASMISSGHDVPASGVRDIGVLHLEPEGPGDRGTLRFSGIGTVLREEEGRIYAARIMDDGPASLAGLQSNTEILQVDGVEVGRLSMSEVVERIRGQEGSDVTLSVLPPGAVYPEKLVITRNQVKMRNR